MRGVLILLAVLLLLAGALTAVGWVLSNSVLVPAPYSLMPEFELLGVKETPAGAPWPPTELPPPLAAASEGAASVAVSMPAPESDRQFADTLNEGVYALMWEGGHGLLGEVLRNMNGEVEREVRLLGGSLPEPGAPARLDNFVYRSDPAAALGLEFEELLLDGPVGELRAWFVPAEGGTAVLMLHGRRRGELIETLRPISAWNELGLPALALAYRNHDASAASPDGLYHYGGSEWQDALVGARELAERGYDRVILHGLSMGGAVALEALKRWPAEAPAVVGVVLDSPLIDPYPVVELGAQKAGMPLPGLATRLGLMVAGWRTGVDFGSLRQHESAPDMSVPLLLIAGDADTTIPISAVDRFAAAVAAPLTYVRLEGVEHVEAWNEGPQRYLGWLRAFLASIVVSA